MVSFTRDELINKIHFGHEGSLQLSFEDCVSLQKILIQRGYAVLMTSGDFGDEYRIDWAYAGDIDNLKYADRAQVVFGSAEYLEMFVWGDYKEEEEESEEA